MQITDIQQVFRMKLIYHIVQAHYWHAASQTGPYTPPGFAADGFIHCCTADQITAVAGRYFHGQAGLVLLCIDPQRVGVEIRYEDLLGSGISYPHIYGPLALAAVQAVFPLPLEPDGAFKLPPNLT